MKKNTLLIAILLSSLIGFAQTVSIGDILCTDGSTVKPAQFASSGKTAEGIVFYVNATDTEGWAVALEDQSSSIKWSSEYLYGIDLLNLPNFEDARAAMHDLNGYTNTGIIRSQGNRNDFPAAWAVDYNNGWYLPTAGQLSKLFGALAFIEDKLQTYGSTLAEDYYWSSSEASSSEAFGLSCLPLANVRAGHFVRSSKSNNYRVRAVRNIHFESPAPEPTLPDNIIEDECNSPLEGKPWGIQLLYSSHENDIASYSPLLAGDINNDGVTDIVVARCSDNYYHSNSMYVFSGNDLSVQSCFDIPDTLSNYIGYAIGRYPMDNGELQGAIFVHPYDKYIRAYAIDGTLLRVSDRPTSCDGMLSLADFNGDGHPEIYSGNDIFDAATLKWLCSGPSNGNRGLGFRGPPLHTAVNTHHTYYAMSLAYDIFGDAKQELICGNTIYDVNIVSRTNPALNAVTENKTISPPIGFSQDGHVLVADFDLDGQDEVLVLRDDTDDHTLGNCYIYAYKPATGQILFQKSHRAYCTSYPLIGNIDNDPYPEIVLLEKQLYNPAKMFCWRFTQQNGLTTIWEQEHNDSSGQTGLTLFDFNQDGIMEIVYRDNRNLRILNGSGKSHVTGNDTIRPYDLYNRMMSSGTGVEYPIVADVNNDGHAEIVATGLLGSTQEVGYGGIHVFGNPSNWSPARPVWNQYMYHVTNVNENLTIPTACFDKATIFTGTDGTIHRPYNNFLQQACYITPNGEPYNPSGYVKTDHYGEGCETYTFHGVTYTESGDYEYLIENPLGCDTLMNVHVQLGDTIHTALYKNECTPYVWNGITYDETGIYEQTFTSEQGCDSIVTLYLTIGNQIFTNFAVSTCDSYTWNGTTYNESGIYTQTFPAANDCDSIVTLDLTIKNSAQISSIHGENLIYYQDDGIYTYSIDTVPGCFGYEWSLDGPWGLNASPDSPVCSIDINSFGSAKLKVRIYTECGFTERSLYIKHDAQPDVVVYPNPTKGEFNIVLYGMKGEAVIVVYDYLGQFIDRFSVDTDVEGTVIPYSLAGKAAGVYLISVMNYFDMVTRKVIKSTPASFGLSFW